MLTGCFFFQAEDGIRDYKVTGVQTCALPILELGKAVERVRVASRPRLRFLRNRSSQGIARAQAARVSRVDGWAAMVETSSPSGWGCCRSSGRRQRSEAGARSRVWEGAAGTWPEPSTRRTPLHVNGRANGLDTSVCDN